jgi:hypothetical protein
MMKSLNIKAVRLRDTNPDESSLFYYRGKCWKRETKREGKPEEFFPSKWTFFFISRKLALLTFIQSLSTFLCIDDQACDSIRKRNVFGAKRAMKFKHLTPLIAKSNIHLHAYTSEYFVGSGCRNEKTRVMSERKMDLLNAP